MAEEAQTEEIAAETQPEPTLDDLLAEYESSEEAPVEPVKAEQPVSEPVSASIDMENRLKRIEQEQDRERELRIERELDNAVKTLKESSETLSGLSDDIVRGTLENYGRTDVRLRRAWIDRTNNPEGFGKVLKALAEDIDNRNAGRPNAELTAAREAARASVMNQGKPSEPEEPDVSRMTGQQILDLTDGLARDAARQARR